MIKLLLIILLSSTCVLISSSSSTNFGLKTTKGEALELLELTTKAIIEGPYAEIQYIQTYNNPLDHAVETKFHFPRTESSIFHKFEAVFQNQTIVGKVLEKQTAKRMYDWNKKRGNTVAYSERNNVAPDIMNIKVGNIPAYETVQIIFSVIQPLEVIVNKFFELKLPVVLTERYSPASVNQNEVPTIKTVDTKGSLYKEWNIQVELKSNTPFAILSNPTHHFTPKLSEKPSGYNSMIYKASWNVTVVPNKDFVVYFGPEKMEKPETILATHPQDPNDRVLLVNFIPDLTTVESKVAQNLLDNHSDGSLKLQKLAYDYDVENAQAEFIFVIDRSGSMDGVRIRNLKRALTKFLNILPKKSYFNIISFGSSYQLYKSHSILNSPQALQEALRWVETIDADMGGTEILEPLRYLTRPENHNHDFPRIVMILTDGDVFNPDQVINLISANNNKMRFCSVGIGHGASHYLVKNMAKAGKCQSEFVLDHEDIGEKAMYLIKAGISQYATDITFDIKCFNDQNQIVKHENAQMDLLLKGQSFNKWVYLNNIANIQTCYVSYSYFNSLQGKRVTEEMDIHGYEIEEINDVWHKVAYNAKIRKLEQTVKKGRVWNEASLKAEIVELSTKYQVLSDYTSFLAVVQESTVAPNEMRSEINIPNMKSADYLSQEEKTANLALEKDHNKEDTLNSDIAANPDIESIPLDGMAHLQVEADVELQNVGECTETLIDADIAVKADLDVEINIGLNDDDYDGVDVGLEMDVDINLYDDNYDGADIKIDMAMDVDIDVDINTEVDVDVNLEVHVTKEYEEEEEEEENSGNTVENIKSKSVGGDDSNGVKNGLDVDVEADIILTEDDLFSSCGGDVEFRYAVDINANIDTDSDMKHKVIPEDSMALNQVFETSIENEASACGGSELDCLPKTESQEKEAKTEEVEQVTKEKNEGISHLKLKQDVDMKLVDVNKSLTANITKLASQDKNNERLNQNLLNTPENLSDNSKIKIAGISLLVMLLSIVFF